MSNSSIVALVGRPNVGKSTLFNRLLQSKQAINHETPGVTRDRQYGEVDWCGQDFTLIDTGGYLGKDIDTWSAGIRQQIHVALQEAAVLLFVLDVRTGPVAQDWDMVDVLRRVNKPVLLVANKADNHALGRAAVEFHALGLGTEVFEVSALNGLGSGELLDAVLAALPGKKSAEADPEADSVPRLALVGRPNAGKSTLLNALVDTPRSLVSAQAGTTRDALVVDYNRYGHRLKLIDTAGLRKRSRMKEAIEFYATIRAIAALGDSDVCLLLVDATLGLQAQDLHLLTLAERRHKGLLLCINKWDTIDKDTHTQDQWRQALSTQLGTLDYAEVAFCSGSEKIGLMQLIEKANAIYQRRKQRISTSTLNNDFLPLLARKPPPSYRGRNVRITYATQLRKDYPHFLFFSNLPKHISANHLRFIERSLRQEYGFGGVPLILSLRKK